MKFTKDQIDEYIEHDGGQCPYCKGFNILQMFDLILDKNKVILHLKCSTCKKLWTDEYLLTHIKPLK